MKTEFPDPDDILNFVLTIDPDEGMYRSGRFTFDFTINQNFPHEPPKVRCREKIYHPNIDLEGKVCLNILREDWKPVLNLNAVIVGLQVWIPEAEAPHAIYRRGKGECTYKVWGSVTNVVVVPFPRTKRIGPAEQGGS
jgi:ubiquitin-protein ligase